MLFVDRSLLFGPTCLKCLSSGEHRKAAEADSQYRVNTVGWKIDRSLRHITPANLFKKRGPSTRISSKAGHSPRSFRKQRERRGGSSSFRKQEVAAAHLAHRHLVRRSAAGQLSKVAHTAGSTSHKGAPLLRDPAQAGTSLPASRGTHAPACARKDCRR